MTYQEQLDEWVKGNSIHNPIRDECCPDFSCCDHDLLWPEERRREFVDAPVLLRLSMLVDGLTGLVEKYDAKLTSSRG